MVTLPDFSGNAEKLRDWLGQRGFLPWDKSEDAEERRLAGWVANAHAAHARGQLSQSDATALESLDGWTWGDGDDEFEKDTEAD